MAGITHTTTTALANNASYDISADAWNEEHTIAANSIPLSKLTDFNYGSAAGSSPITVAHGLSTTPTIVILTAYATQPYALAYTADATNIVIRHNAAGSLTVKYLAMV